MFTWASITTLHTGQMLLVYSTNTSSRSVTTTSMLPRRNTQAQHSSPGPLSQADCQRPDKVKDLYADLVQETLLRAYRNTGRFDGEHPRAWLLTIMRNGEAKTAT